MMDFEGLIDQHSRIIRRIEELFEKLSEVDDTSDIEKELIHLFWRLSIIRKRINKTLSLDDIYTDDVLTLLEYYSLIGLSEEEELLTRALNYGLKGYKLLSSRISEFKENINDVRKLKSKLERIVALQQ